MAPGVQSCGCKTSAESLWALGYDTDAVGRHRRRRSPARHRRPTAVRNSCDRNYVVETMTTFTVQRAADRFLTDAGWLHSHHSFNFGPHHSSDHEGHGLLLVNNDDVVEAGQGFGTHGHRDMEIVTWVLSGRLEHKDSAGNHGILYPGLAQRMSAGSGIRPASSTPARRTRALLQMWVPSARRHPARLRTI